MKFESHCKIGPKARYPQTVPPGEQEKHGRVKGLGTVGNWSVSNPLQWSSEQRNKKAMVCYISKWPDKIARERLSVKGDSSWKGMNEFFCYLTGELKWAEISKTYVQHIFLWFSKLSGKVSWKK